MNERSARGDNDAELLRAMQREHGDALFAHALRLTGGDRQRAEDVSTVVVCVVAPHRVTPISSSTNRNERNA